MRHRTRMTGFDDDRMNSVVQAVIEFDGSRAKAARKLGLSIMQVRRQITNATMRGNLVPDAKVGCRRPETLDRLPTDPTEEEILAACEVIRRGWGRHTERLRRLAGAVRWSIPVPGEAWRGAVEEACA
jgi:hypothetical protein